MIFCNPAPIAASCYVDRDLADAVLSAFAQAVKDLTSLGKNLDIKIGALRISIFNRNLKYTFETSFTNNLNLTSYEKQMKKSVKETKSHWT